MISLRFHFFWAGNIINNITISWQQYHYAISLKSGSNIIKIRQQHHYFQANNFIIHWLVFSLILG